MEAMEAAGNSVPHGPINIEHLEGAIDVGHPNGGVDVGHPNGVMNIEGAQPAPLEIFAYKSHFQPYRSWFGILATSLVIIFYGWWAFVSRGGRFQASDFVSCYIAVSSHVSLLSLTFH